MLASRSTSIKYELYLSASIQALIKVVGSAPLGHSGWQNVMTADDIKCHESLFEGHSESLAWCGDVCLRETSFSLKSRFVPGKFECGDFGDFDRRFSAVFVHCNSSVVSLVL